MAKLLTGKEVTAALNEELIRRTEQLQKEGRTPSLAVLRLGENPSDLAYERGILKKAEAVGIRVERILLPEETEKDVLIREIEKLNRDPEIHGVLLFRPLPERLREYEDEIANSLVPEKDVDCMTDLSHAGVYTGKKLGYPPCTAEACMRILDYYGIDPKGKNAVVIGRSLVIGKPVSMMLLSRHATVTICHTRTLDLPSVSRGADLLITAAGALKSLTKDHVRPGQTVIDVSVNYDPDKNGGKGGLAGDAVFDQVEGVVEAITPVPGGVGTVTVTVLLEHVVRSAERKG